MINANNCKLCGKLLIWNDRASRHTVTRPMEWQKAGHVKRSKCVAACVTGHDTVNKVSLPIKKESNSYVLLTLSGSFC